MSHWCPGTLHVKNESRLLKPLSTLEKIPVLYQFENLACCAYNPSQGRPRTSVKVGVVEQWFCYSRKMTRSPPGDKLGITDKANVLKGTTAMNILEYLGYGENTTTTDYESVKIVYLQG
jgi:hypothetical protein